MPNEAPKAMYLVLIPLNLELTENRLLLNCGVNTNINLSFKLQTFLCTFTTNYFT
jgi:hypothetical protein